jgi:hypothetical protein
MHENGIDKDAPILTIPKNGTMKLSNKEDKSENELIG